MEIHILYPVGNTEENLGSLSLTQKEDGRWDLTSYKLIPVSDKIKADEETQQKIDALMDTVDEKYLSNFGIQERNSCGK